MKKFFTFLLLTTVVALAAIQACNKDEGQQPNIAPVANAGNDTTLFITPCTTEATVYLDGNLSHDPGNLNLLKYSWKQVSGPQQAFQGLDSNKKIVIVHFLVTGEYKFELEVHDPEGLSSKDSIIVNVSSITDNKTLELDLPNSVYEFGDNVPDYYGDIYDEFSIGGYIYYSNVSYSYSFYENSDSAAINKQFICLFNFYDQEDQLKYMSGECSLDFEAIYLKGGGSFDGTIKLARGSAFDRCSEMFQDFPPVQVLGSMDTTAKTITIKLKGKIIL